MEKNATIIITGVPDAAEFDPYTLTDTSANLSWRVNTSFNAPVINYQLEFKEIPHGQWIIINIPANLVNDAEEFYV